jgi:hypothetical protein
MGGGIAGTEALVWKTAQLTYKSTHPAIQAICPILSVLSGMALSTCTAQHTHTFRAELGAVHNSEVSRVIYPFIICYNEDP